MAKRKKTIKVDEYYRIDMHTCYRWCLHNGIKIYPVASNTGSHYIEIDNNEIITRSPKEYTKKEVHKKVWELYCYFYDTNN